MGTSRAAITKELRAHFTRQSPEGGQFTSGGGSLLRSQVSGGTLYYVAKCPGGCLLRSRVSGGHSTTGGRLLRDRTSKRHFHIIILLKLLFDILFRILYTRHARCPDAHA